MATMFLAIAVSAMWIVGATAAITSHCDSSTSGMLSCYSYVTGADTKPPTECCEELTSLNINSPTCLCQLITKLNVSEASQPVLNITKAFNLPKDCAITLNTSDCHATLPTAPSPSPSAAVPTTSSPDKGSTATDVVESLVPDNDVQRLLPTSWKAVGVAAAAALVTLQGLW